MAVKILSVHPDSPIKHLVRCGDTIVNIDGINAIQSNLDYIAKMKNVGEIRRLLICRKDSWREDNVICANFGTKHDTIVTLGIETKSNDLEWSSRDATKRYNQDIRRIKNDQKARKAQIEKISPKTGWTKMDYVPLMVTVGLIVVLMTIWSFFA